MIRRRPPRPGRRAGAGSAGVVAAVVAVLLTGAVGAAQDRPRSVEEHLAQLRDARDLALRAIARPSPAAMDDVRRTAGRPVDVELAGVTLTLGEDPVLRGLTGDSAEDLRTAAERLEHLATELTAAAARRVEDPDRLRSALDDAYRGLAPAPTFGERVLRAIGDLLVRLLGSLSGRGRIVGVLAAVALALIAVAGLIFFGRRTTIRGDRSTGHPDPRGVDTRDLRREAEAAFQAGDLETALRLWYRLLLVHLDRRGILRDAPSVTPAEARAAGFRHGGPLSDPVAAATSTFERVVYGSTTVEPGAVETVRHAAERSGP